MNITIFNYQVMVLINKFFNNDEVEYIFNGRLDFDSFCTQILFELYKEDFLEEMATQPLRSFVKDGDTFDADYEKKKRTIRYTNKGKERLKKRVKELGFNTDQVYGLEILKIQKNSEKSKGLPMKQQNIVQLEAIEELEILKAIEKKRIISVKKVSVYDFIHMYDKLDDYYTNISKNNKDFFSNLINLYDIERHYATELIYRIAEYMEEQNFKLEKFNYEPLCRLFAISIGNDYVVTNRFLTHRHLYIRELLSDNRIEKNRIDVMLIVKTALFCKCKEELKTEYKNLNKTIVEEHLKANYNLFFLHISKKKWNKKKVQYARFLYEQIFGN